MRTFFNVVVFSLLSIGLFAGYSRYGIPQIEPAPPPEAETLDLGAMTMEEFLTLGERVYLGKGACTLCHTEVGGRAPLLEDVAVIAKDRLADDRYQGTSTDVAGYLYESMVDTSAFVVAGFGKAGTDDSESPMPNMQSGTTGLTEAEVIAVVAYLQDLGGTEVTVDIPAAAAEVAAAVEEEPEDEDVKEEEERAAFEALEAIIADFACGACHKIGEDEGELGPDLTTIGARRDRDYLRRAILLPNADIAEGFEAEMMPGDYGELLYAGELEMLVNYLAELK